MGGPSSEGINTSSTVALLPSRLAETLSKNGYVASFQADNSILVKSKAAELPPAQDGNTGYEITTPRFGTTVGTQHKTCITINNEVTNDIGGKYFKLYSLRAGYDVWINATPGASVDPAPIGYVPMPVSIEVGQSAADLAAAIAKVISTTGPGANRPSEFDVQVNGNQIID